MLSGGGLCGSPNCGLRNLPLPHAHAACALLKYSARLPSTAWDLNSTATWQKYTTYLHNTHIQWGFMLWPAIISRPAQCSALNLPRSHLCCCSSPWLTPSPCSFAHVHPRPRRCGSRVSRSAWLGRCALRLGTPPPAPTPPPSRTPTHAPCCDARCRHVVMGCCMLWLLPACMLWLLILIHCIAVHGSGWAWMDVPCSPLVRNSY